MDNLKWSTISRIALLCLLLSVLSACVSVRTPTDLHQHFQKISSKTRIERLKQLTSWTISGAFSLQHPPAKAVLANYTWRESGDNQSSIRISSALNLYTVKILRLPDNVTLWRGNKESYQAKSAQQLMQRLLGWSLPIKNLVFWIKGAPAPGKYKAKFDQYGHLKLLHQQGWRISYAAYESKDLVDLPKVVYMTRPNILVKIVIRRWQLTS